MPARYTPAIRCWLTSSPFCSTGRYAPLRVAAAIEKTGAKLKSTLRASVARAVPTSIAARQRGGSAFDGQNTSTTGG